MEHQAHKKHSWWQPLHLIISGSSRTGKSTLLRSVQRLLGNDAALIEPTIIHRGQSTSFNDKRRWVSKSIMPTIQTILPYVHHDLLFAGPLLSQSVLLLDDMVHSSSSLTFPSADMIALNEMLSGQISVQTSKTYFEYCTPSSSSYLTSSSNFASDAQVIVVAHAESKSITELTQLFSLTLRLHACLSIEDNIKYSERTIAASTSRSSLSTCLLHSSSSSSSCSSASPLSTLSPSQEKFYKENVREFAQTDNVLERQEDFISYEDVKKIIDTSPTVAVLEHFFVMKQYEHVYANKLLANYSLLKSSLVCVKPTSLPLPSALRGTAFCSTNDNNDNSCDNRNQGNSSFIVDTTDVGSSCRSLHKNENVKICDLSHVDFAHHLRTLCALTLARLSLYGSELLCVDVETAEEVWEVYSTHLRSVASYVNDANCTSFQKESPNQSLLFAAHAREYSSTPRCTSDEFALENCDILSNKENVTPSHNTCKLSYYNNSSRMQNAGTDTHSHKLYALCDISSSKLTSNTLLETYKMLNGSGAGMCNGKRRRNNKNSSKKTLVQNFLHTINSIRQENSTVTTEILMNVYEKYGGELGLGDTFSNFIEKLQFHGLIIRTRHGWVPTLLEYVKPRVDK